MMLTLKHRSSVHRLSHQRPPHARSPQARPPPTTVQRGASLPHLMKLKYGTHQGTGRSLPAKQDVSSKGKLSGGKSLGRIKVVFTPTICKMVCAGGRCQNVCEKGNTTTLISEHGHGADMLTGSGFRVVVCPIPCRNGGTCETRDKCRCPSNFTGKFCHIPVQAPRHNGQQQEARRGSLSGLKHSTFTMPVSPHRQGSHGRVMSSVMNVHVRHPKEASVQVHEVSRVDSFGQHNNQKQQNWQSHTYQLPYNRQQPQVPQRRPVAQNLGRCFQEISPSQQCHKPLPHLVKKDDCCGSVGASWGFSKCNKCPPKHDQVQPGMAHPIKCLAGFKQDSFMPCRDINECQMPGICPNGKCRNLKGSYMCICDKGYTPNTSMHRCISNKALEKTKDVCYRTMDGALCTNPIAKPISKPVCCCTVGQAWGSKCERCPSENSKHYWEICPAGKGIVYEWAIHTTTIENITTWLPVLVPTPNFLSPPTTPPRPTIQEVSRTTNRLVFRKPITTTSTPINIHPNVDTSVEAHGIGDPRESECASKPEVCGPGVCKDQANSYYCECNFGYEFLQHLGHCVDIDECNQFPRACTNGRCTNMEGSFKCSCPAGLAIDRTGSACLDVNECESDPCQGNGHCRNTPGSYTCWCRQGFVKTKIHNLTTCHDINECLQESLCPGGLCINVPGSYRCKHCPSGYLLNTRGDCDDVDECQQASTCPTAKCINRPGSYDCAPCPDGFQGKNGRCHDIDECLQSDVCQNGICVNTEGSYTCTPCTEGYQVSPDGTSCQDVDECANGACHGGECVNIPGSFTCSCPSGFQQTEDDRCTDINECETESVCLAHGECLNTDGSFVCVCDHGYVASADGHSCEDRDECADGAECPHGKCVNTPGSYICDCDTGFLLDTATQTCTDVDECQQYSENICGSWQCENTLGSYRCIQTCPLGFELELDQCIDIDECLTAADICGPNSFCKNMEGSYRCLCDQGYQQAMQGRGCVDVNECEMLNRVCGNALCENVDGSFLCVCPDDTQEFDTTSGLCITIRAPAPPKVSVEGRKECYINLNDVNFCDNVLAVNITKEECCCTIGAGWGDNCEIYPCPVVASEDFVKLCPEGRGRVPNGDAENVVDHKEYTDADECSMFAEDICKNGYCFNMQPGYECFCRTGFHYDPLKLECLDIDECTRSENCIGGSCVNRQGSYDCFCPLHTTLDRQGKLCINESTALHDDHGAAESEMVTSMCWKGLSSEFVCSDPLIGMETSYTECCCLYGRAWGLYCALCPQRSTADFGKLCNVPRGEDAVAALSSHGRTFIDRDFHQERSPPVDELQPGVLPLYVPSEYDDYKFGSFEGLQAEECGILSGCENGRCVRVPEGYTCDCYDGYHLDISHMACIDVNECEELNDRMYLCRNAECVNTEGSFKCVCLPGFVPSSQHNYCVAQETDAQGGRLRKGHQAESRGRSPAA
uniref:latent-transforming growth factor beta-binding protein 1 n=1 Tax=Myxine glutinosa TaxID=7769 RepID=UPI00358F952B